MYLIDTNIFLEYFLEQENSDLSKKILKNLEDGSANFIITNFAIHSIIVIAERFGVIEEISHFLQKLLEFDNIIIHYLTLEEELDIIYSLEKLDFDDGIQAYVANIYDASILTFDRDLLSHNDIQTIHPKDY